MVDDSVWRELRIRSIMEGRSMSSLVIEAITAYLNNAQMLQSASAQERKSAKAPVRQNANAPTMPSYLEDNPWVQIIRSR